VGLESVSIVLELENVFSVEFPDRIAREARTVRDLEDLVLQLRAEQLEPQVRDALTEAEVRATTRGVVAKELRIDAALVTPEADLVVDLGMDA
jgi:acyl carrier protein